MNRFIAFAFATLAAFAGFAYAQEGPHIIEAAPRVMVFQFSPIGDPGAYQWLGTGIQQSLLVEVNRPGSIAWSMPAAAPSTQPSNPVADAARAGATMAVFGSFQIANDEVRVTGQAMDTGTGRVLAALKATGSLHDLFKVEDALDGQLQAALPHEQAAAAVMSAPVQESQTETPPTVVENDVQVVDPNYSYADTYGLPYPYYATGFYLGYPNTFAFSGGHRFHDGFHDGFHHFGGSPFIGSTFHGGFHTGGFSGGVGGANGRGFGVAGFHSGGFGGGRR